jgi:SnoaL-like protein
MQSPTCDRCDIADRIGALAVHVDARRWDQILDLLAPEVDVDYTSLFGGAPQSLTREQLVDGWRRLLPGFTQTTHVIGTPTITVGAHTARASASVVAWHFIKDAVLNGNDLWLVGGCYEMTFRQADGVWRIAKLALARAWAEGNTDLPRIAGERAAQSVSA